jgi:negative regulator of flagellin synthesis FlgM
MHIYGPASLHGPQPIGPPHHLRSTSPPARPASPAQTDSVEISEAAQRASESQIAEGTYETDQKLSIALDRLLDQIG